jgi:predicted KAP-like P-loop ATPase
MRDLLSRLDKELRSEVLKQALLEGHAVTIIVEFIRTLDNEHGRYDVDNSTLPEETRLVSEDCLNELELIAAEKVNEAAKNGSLLNVLHLPFILYNWQNWRKEEVVDWIQNIMIDDKNLIKLLEKFVSKSYTNIGVKHFFDPDLIKAFIDPALLIDRVRRISEQEDLTESQKSAINLFIRGYELRLQGKNPS